MDDASDLVLEPPRVTSSIFPSDEEPDKGPLPIVLRIRRQLWYG